MVVYLSPFAGAGWQFFDDNGVPLAGGKLYTYNAGTTSLTPTYTDKYGTVANTNPIILDSAGRVPYEIWLTLGLDYKFIVKTATDTLIRTYDYISLNAVFNSGVINTVGYFDHTGAFNTSNNFTFNDLTNTLGVTGNISSSTLGVTGNTTVGGTLGVTGNTTVGGTLGVTGNTTVGGTLGVTGNTTVGGTLGVTGNTTVGGTLGVTGALTAATIKSISGTYTSAATATTVTLTTFANVADSSWLVTGCVSNQSSATNYSCAGILTTQGSTAVYTGIKTAGNLTLSISGLNLQANQTSGSAKDIKWTLLQFA